VPSKIRKKRELISIALRRPRLFGASVVCAVALCALIGARAPDPAPGTRNTPAPHYALQGTTDSARTTLTRTQLFAGSVPREPVDDSTGFAMPAEVRDSEQIFEGILTLGDVAKSGSFNLLSDVFHLIPERDSIWKHLAPFDFQFVQSGNYLIPAQQGLAISGSRVWNYIVGPGRVWQEAGDQGYARASLPFALIQRNQNCVHNGEMTFLFSNSATPNISNVYYQITQETCYPMKFDMWGMISAQYTPGAVPGSEDLKAEHAQELAHRLPSKPFDDLAKDYPDSDINVRAFEAAYKDSDNITTYGLMLHGTNYVSGCPTRYGEYAFCADMRVPSYSIAKSVFAGVALMRLGQLYGSGVYSERIKDYIPQYSTGGKWDVTTFGNTSDMATGNYDLAGYEADENSLTMDKFLVDEAYGAKIADAFAFKKHYATPGTKWVYQSSATFLLTQAMNAYWNRHGGNGGAGRDIFDAVRDEIYKPLHLGVGSLTTIRTDDSPNGAPSGYYGLFFNQDDIAKIGDFLNNGKGVIDGKQLLDPTRLEEALFRGASVSSTGVPILGQSPASLLGAPATGRGKSVPKNARRYSHGFWGRSITTGEFPQYPCNFWGSFMAGYGGNIVMLLPDGATFYIFTDGMEFPWAPTVEEINKVAPMCK